MKSLKYFECLPMNTSVVVMLKIKVYNEIHSMDIINDIHTDFNNIHWEGCLYIRRRDLCVVSEIWRRRNTSTDFGLRTTVRNHYHVDMDVVGNISGNFTIELPFASVLGVQEYTAMVTVLLVLLVPPQLFLSVITIAGLCAGKDFKKIKVQRNLMIAITAMGFISSITVVMLAIAEYLFLNHHKEAGVVFCHSSYLFRHIDYALRDIFMVFFSFSIFIVIKHGQSKLRGIYINIALFISILIVFILGIIYVVPPAINFSFQLDGVFCFPLIFDGGLAGIILTLVFINIPERICSLGIAIAIIVFVKKHSTALAENEKLKRAIVKFVAMIVVLNAIIVVGIILPFVISWIAVVDVATFVVFLHLLFFLLPSTQAIIIPLMMIAVFKSLRVAIKATFFPWCYRDHDVIIHRKERKITLSSSGTPVTTSNGEA